MAILIECPDCKYRNSENALLCRRCSLDLKKARDKTYWIEFYDANGKRHRQRIGPWRKIALEVLAKRKAEIAENKFLDKAKEPPKMLFKDFAAQYLKWCEANNRWAYRKKVIIKALNSVFGDKLLFEITTWDIEKYKLARRKENRKSNGKPIKVASVNRELAVLKHLFTKAIEWEFLKENPAKPVKLFKENNKRLRFLSEEEIDRLLSVCNNYLKDIILVALNTGMRKGEVFNLKWQNIDFHLKLLHVSDSKNYEGRDIPINDVLYNILKALKNKIEPHEDYVFMNPKTAKPYNDIRESFKIALRQAGIIDFTFHDLRHTFASHLVMNGVDLMTVKELLGHKNISMTIRYSHLSPDHKRIAVRKIEEVFKDKTKVIELPVKQN